MEHTYVIPAYKESPYLEECIKSLLKQTQKSNVLVATATPSPYLEEITKKYGLGYFINRKAPGIASDWNFALSKATTKLVTIAHQDDIYDQDYGRLVVDKFNGNLAKNPLMVFTNYDDLLNNKIRKGSLNSVVKSMLLFPFHIKSVLSNRFLKKSTLVFGDPICCPSVTLNMGALSNFEFSKEYDCALDWLAWLELADRKGAFIYIDRKLVQHRVHEDSETSFQLSTGKRRLEELSIFKKIWGKQIARFFSWIYSLGHKDNIV